MRYPNYAGVEKRIKERLVALGYGDDTRLDVARFIKEHGYDARVFYPWLKGRTPSPENLQRLARDLQTSPGWLAFGEEMAAPIGGGSENAAPLPGEAHITYGADTLRLIGQFWHRLWTRWHPVIPSWRPLPRTWSMASTLAPAGGGA